MNTPTLTTYALALLALTAQAHAQTQQPPASNKLGQQIASSGAPDKGVAACVSCHGAQGEGNAAGGFPRLAGLPQQYLADQLAAYADGRRRNPVMEPIAKGLDKQQIAAVSAYYAALDAPWAKPAGQPDAAAQKRGRQLAEVGDERIAVQSCANCHGPGGSGEPPNIPYLSGQHQSYLTAALNAWKSGTRKTDPSGQMNTIASRLSDSDINAVAAYFAAQPAPKPPVGNVPERAPASSGGTQTGSTPTQGVGVEQGAATMGGQQGPGGGGGGSGAGAQGSPTGSTP